MGSKTRAIPKRRRSISCAEFPPTRFAPIPASLMRIPGENEATPATPQIPRRATMFMTYILGHRMLDATGLHTVDGKDSRGTPPKAPRGGARSRGFTLIELLVVMAIVA